MMGMFLLYLNLTVKLRTLINPNLNSMGLQGSLWSLGYLENERLQILRALVGVLPGPCPLPLHTKERH